MHPPCVQICRLKWERRLVIAKNRRVDYERPDFRRAEVLHFTPCLDYSFHLIGLRVKNKVNWLLVSDPMEMMGYAVNNAVKENVVWVL